MLSRILHASRKYEVHIIYMHLEVHNSKEAIAMLYLLYKYKSYTDNESNENKNLTKYRQRSPANTRTCQPINSTCRIN